METVEYNTLKDFASMNKYLGRTINIIDSTGRASGARLGITEIKQQ